MHDDKDLQILGFGLLADGGVEVGYVRVPEDLKKNGLIWQHTVQIPRGSDYDDELDAVMEAIAVLTRDVLEDQELAEPIDIDEPEDEEDEEEDE
jgi:hypothetical protein